MGVNIINHPPMGWNSWDCFGGSVNEEQLLANARYMRDNLKDYGWEYVVCDIQWSEPGSTGHYYRNFTELCMDEYSRLIPAENRFPSSAEGKGFKPIADEIHKMGLKEDPNNFLLMHAAGANVSGQIASVVAGGLVISLATQFL